MKGNYVKGRKAEYRCREFLQGLGVGLVFRSAGSRGPADLVAFFPIKREIWLIQVKTGKKVPSLSKLAREYGILRELEGEYQVKAYLFVKQQGRFQLKPLSEVRGVGGVSC